MKENHVFWFLKVPKQTKTATAFFAADRRHLQPGCEAAEALVRPQNHTDEGQTQKVPPQLPSSHTAKSKPALVELIL